MFPCRTVCVLRHNKPDCIITLKLNVQHENTFQFTPNLSVKKTYDLQARKRNNRVSVLYIIQQLLTN